jgi:polyferredoxin
MSSPVSPPARKRPLSTSRKAFQITALVLTVLIGLRHALPVSSSRGGSLDAFCPLGGLETLWPYLAEGTTLKSTHLLNFSVLLAVLGTALLAGRSFCGWLCPVGTVQDFLGERVSRWLPFKKVRRGKNHPGGLPTQISPALDQRLRSAKYLVLALAAAASTAAVYPPLRDICPARALFSFKLRSPLLLSVLGVFLVTSILNRRFWCKYLCPLGAVLAPFNKTAPLRVSAALEQCPSCGKCSAVCPMDIDPVPENLTSPECIQCLECLESCEIEGTLNLELGPATSSESSGEALSAG